MGNTSNKEETTSGGEKAIEDEQKAFSAKRNKKRLDRDVEKETASLVARAADGGVHKIVETMNDMNDKLALQKDLVVQNGLLNALCAKARSVTEASENSSRLDFHAANAVEAVGRLIRKLYGDLKLTKKESICHTVALCCEAYSCIAKIRVQKKWFVADELHTYILEALKHFKEDEKVVFWAVNALYHMSKDGPNIIVSNVKAMLDSDAKATLRSALLCQNDDKDIEAHVLLLMSVFDVVNTDDELFLNDENNEVLGIDASNNLFQ